MILTGRPDGPALGPPEGLVPYLDTVARMIAAASEQVGDAVSIDPLQLLGERAAISGFTRRGPISCGGGTRLLQAYDDWVGVSLTRGDDWELVPAWLEVDLDVDGWDALAPIVADRTASELVLRAGWLGLPVARLAERGPSSGRSAVRSGRLARDPSPVPIGGLVVADLTALWAGPMVGDVLACAGANVVKVESSSRPDGARRGPAAFFDLMNGRKRSVALDLGSSDGRATLRRVVDAADVVLTSSRARAVEQLGLDPELSVRSGRTRVWLSISGYGSGGRDAERVAFGDDAAVAGGLVSWDDDGPMFCADAIADPATGMVASAAVLGALADGGRWLIDVSMADVAWDLAGPTVPARDLDAARPTARRAVGRGPALGADTDAVLAELGVA